MSEITLPPAGAITISLPEPLPLAPLFSSDSANWRTPEEIWGPLFTEFNPRLDLAADASASLCDFWLGPGALNPDALVFEDWAEVLCGKAGWLNPPFSRREKMPIAPWIERCYRTQQAGGRVVSLIPARADTQWWHRWVMKARQIRLIEGRVRFIRPSGEVGESAPFPSAVVIWDGWGLPLRSGPEVIGWKP